MNDYQRRWLARKLVGTVLKKTWAGHRWIRSLKPGVIDKDGNVDVCIWLRVPAAEIAEYETVRHMDQARRNRERAREREE